MQNGVFHFAQNPDHWLYIGYIQVYIYICVYINWTHVARKRVWFKVGSETVHTLALRRRTSVRTRCTCFLVVPSRRPGGVPPNTPSAMLVRKQSRPNEQRLIGTSSQSKCSS